jgi:hypothetical protein
LLRGQRGFRFAIALSLFKLKYIRQVFMRLKLFTLVAASGAFVINAAALKLK